MNVGFYKCNGPVKHLQNQRALIRVDPIADSHYLAQFDSLHLTESHGWVSIQKTDFITMGDINEFMLIDND